MEQCTLYSKKRTDNTMLRSGITFQDVQLHHSASKARQLIPEQKCVIKTLLTNHAEPKVINTSDEKEKQKQTFLARSSD